MPGLKNRRLRRRPKRFARRKVKKNHMSKMVLHKQPGIPDRYMAKFRFISAVGHYVNPTTQGEVFYVNYPQGEIGTKRRPMYFDQFAALYNRYCVTGAKITAFITNQSSSVPVNLVTTFTNGIPSTGTWTFDYAAQSRYAQVRVLGTADGIGSIKVSRYMSMKQLTGNNNIANNPDFYTSTLIDANNILPPPNNPAFYFWIAESTDHVSNINLYVSWEIVYYIIFTEPRQPSASGEIDQDILEHTLGVTGSIPIACELGVTGPEGR